MEVDDRERGVEVSSTWESVYPLASGTVLSPEDLLTVSGYEEADLAWGQSMVLHAPLVGQGGHYFASRTVRIGTDIV